MIYLSLSPTPDRPVPIRVIDSEQVIGYILFQEWDYIKQAWITKFESEILDLVLIKALTWYPLNPECYKQNINFHSKSPLGTSNWTFLCGYRSWTSSFRTSLEGFRMMKKLFASRYSKLEESPIMAKFWLERSMIIGEFVSDSEYITGRYINSFEEILREFEIFQQNLNVITEVRQ